MDRELLLITLTLALCGPALLACGLVTPPLVNERNPYRLERIRWAQLWLGLVPAMLLFGTLVGWAVQEPSESDERVSVALLLAICPFAAIWLRAAVRAGLALRHIDPGVAATVGLIRPRVVIASALAVALDADELAAVRAHEDAHARHRDPLRLWLGQLATDLQWPFPGAFRRFRRWRLALEIARDAEARFGGADGADLAAAIVIAAGLESYGRPTLAALSAGDDIRDRVTRLLEPAPDPVPSIKPWALGMALTALAVLAILVGVSVGEDLVRALPGVVT